MQTSPTSTGRDQEDRPAARPTVAVLCADDHPPGMSPAEERCEVRYATAEQLPGALAGADALFVWDFLSTAVENAWPAADRLRWVHIASAGVDRLMFPALVHSHVTVTNSRGVFERPIAEYVLGLVLAFAKDLPGTWALQRDHTWRHRETDTLVDRRVVVVGSGPIGREVACLLRAVGLDVAVVARSRRTDPELGTLHGTDELRGLAAGADFVVAALPLTPETTGLFDAGFFRAMPSGARFVNVGRGPSVVEADLVEALRTGQIAGAALDVLAEEPLPPEDPLWDVEGLLVSPHMSGDARGWRDRLARLFGDNLDRWLSGAPLRNVVDKERGYVPGPAQHRTPEHGADHPTRDNDQEGR